MTTPDQKSIFFKVQKLTVFYRSEYHRPLRETTFRDSYSRTKLSGYPTVLFRFPVSVACVSWIRTEAVVHGPEVRGVPYCTLYDSSSRVSHLVHGTPHGCRKFPRVF